MGAVYGKYLGIGLERPADGSKLLFMFATPAAVLEKQFLSLAIWWNDHSSNLPSRLVDTLDRVGEIFTDISNHF